MDLKQQRYKIGEFAKLTGLSVPTLRYYDKIGLLAPEVKLPSGYRLYSGRQLFQTQFISNMKSVGLSLEDIRDLMQHPQPEDILPRLEALYQKLVDELRQISNLEKYFRIGKEHIENPFAASQIEQTKLPATYARARRLRRRRQKAYLPITHRYCKKAETILVCSKMPVCALSCMIIGSACKITGKIAAKQARCFAW